MRTVRFLPLLVCSFSVALSTTYSVPLSCGSLQTLTMHDNRSVSTQRQRPVARQGNASPVSKWVAKKSSWDEGQGRSVSPSTKTCPKCESCDRLASSVFFVNELKYFWAFPDFWCVSVSHSLPLCCRVG